jgi:hypothetical protein
MATTGMRGIILRLGIENNELNRTTLSGNQAL